MVPLAKAQTPQLWICSVTCGAVSAKGFQPKRPTGGLLDVKHAKEHSKIFKPMKIWPLGYEFKLDAPGPTRPLPGETDTFGCEGSGETAEKAIQSLENRITGKNLSVIARKCEGCGLAHLKDATCQEARSSRSIPYTVLKSRLSPDVGANPSDSTSTATQAQ